MSRILVSDKFAINTNESPQRSRNSENRLLDEVLMMACMHSSDLINLRNSPGLDLHIPRKRLNPKEQVEHAKVTLPKVLHEAMS